MAFITADDYKAYIKDANLIQMVESDDTIREQAETVAISQAKEYLYERYDTDIIFAATGTDRHPYLLRNCINIVLYLLHKRLPKRMMSDDIKDDYDETLAYLEKVVDGKISSDLPRKKEDDNTPKTKFRWGSNNLRTY